LNTLNDTDPRIREAYLYKRLGNSSVQCNTCHKMCVLKEGEIGFCKTRKNIEGKLHTIMYGDISSYSLHHIEKLPAYHYFPSSIALTFGSWGCNIACDWCNNWDITMNKPPEKFSHDIFINFFCWNRLEKYMCMTINIQFNHIMLILIKSSI